MNNPQLSDSCLIFDHKIATSLSPFFNIFISLYIINLLLFLINYPIEYRNRQQRHLIKFLLPQISLSELNAVDTSHYCTSDSLRHLPAGLGIRKDVILIDHREIDEIRSCPDYGACTSPIRLYSRSALNNK